MTTWTLIIILAIGSNASTSFSIGGIKSIDECRKVEMTIKSGPIWKEYVFLRNASQCIEVAK